MSKEIVTISVPKGELDNDYTFYEDGKIHHVYDQSIYKPNLEAWITARNISPADREKILKECPQEHKSKIAAILKK
jgi:hypothetical protein